MQLALPCAISCSVPGSIGRARWGLAVMTESSRLTRSVLASIVALLAAGCGALTTPEERVARAEQLLAAGDYGEAQVELKNAIGNEPNNAAAQIVLAKLSLQTGDLDGADRALQAAGQSDSPVASELRARVLWRRGEFDKLLQLTSVEQSALTEPERSLYQAHALAGLRRFPEAKELFASLVLADASFVAARLGLVDCKLAMGDQQGALSELESAVSLSGESADVWIALGNMQQLAGAMGLAQRSWSRALELASGKVTLVQHLGLFSSLAELRLSRGDLNGARALYDGMVKVSSQNILTRLLEANIAIATGGANSVAAELQRMVSANPGFPPLRIALINALLGQENLQQALVQFEDLLLQLPKDGQVARARDAAREASRSATGSSGRLLSIAASLSALGQPLAAKAALAKVLESEPLSLQAALGLVILELRMGNHDQAATLAATLREKYPNEAAAAALHGDANAARQRYAEAEKAYAAAWALRKDAPTALALYRVRQRGKLGLEVESLEQLLDSQPKQTAVRAIYAEALRTAGRQQDAIVQLERVTAEAPRDQVAWNNLAWLYLQIGDRRGLVAARRARDLAPQSAQIADTYGWALIQTGNFLAALEVLKPVAEGAKNQPQITYHYAVALAKTGETTQARALLTELLSSKTPFPEREAARQLLSEL